MKPCTLKPFQFLVPLDQIAFGGFTMQAPIVNISNSNDLLKNSPKIELTKSRWLYRVRQRTKSARKLKSMQVVLNASRFQIHRLHRNYSQLFYLIIFTDYKRFTGYMFHFTAAAVQSVKTQNCLKPALLPVMA